MTISPPTTRTVTDHGLLIFAPGGLAVGAIVVWSPSQGQAVTSTFAFGDTVVGQNDVPPGRGEPYENVPGNATEPRIQIERYEINGARFVDAFGTRRLEMLTRQDEPLTLREAVAGPANTVVWTKIYYGFWFDNLGIAMNAEGNRIVRARASGRYTRIREI